MELTGVLVAAGVLSLTLLLIKLFTSPIDKEFAKMPGPPQPLGPFIGSWPFRPYDEQFKHKAELSAKYGGVVRKRVLAINYVIVTDVEVARQVLDDKESFADRFPNGVRYFMPLGLIALETNEMWKGHRQLVSRIFADKFLRQYADVFGAKALTLVDVIKNRKPGESFNVHHLLSELSLDAIGIAGFGHDFQLLERPDERTYYDAATAVNAGSIFRSLMPFELLYRILFRDVHKQSTEALRLFRDLVHKVRQQTRTTDARTLLDILNDAQLPEEEIVDELVTMALAGHETTASTMSFALWELALNPDVQRKVQEEVDEIWVDGFDPKKEETMFDAKQRMVYLRAVFEETLRKYPTVPVVPRIAAKRAKVGQYEVPAGTYVSLALVPMGRSPRNFEDPLAFKPERFLDRPENEKPRFIPFGGGARVCVGRRFAELEALVVLSILLRHYNVEPDLAYPLREAGMISFMARDGIWVRMTPRVHD